MGNKALKAGIWYTIGNIFIKGINFLSIPIFARMMTTEDFGLYNVFISYESLFIVLIGLALHVSLRSARQEFKEFINEYTSTITLLYIFSLIIFIAILVITGDGLEIYLSLNKRLIFLLLFMSFGGAILTLYNNWISLEYSYIKYIIVAGINSVANIALSLLFMLTIYDNERGLGRIFGATFITFGLSLVIIILMYKKARPTLKIEYFKFGLGYSLPIVPHGISQVALAQFDRIMIANMIGVSAAGIFSLGGNIRNILAIITESISTAWSTWFYENMEIGNFYIIQSRARLLLQLFTVLCILTMAIIPELVFCLGGKAYESAKFIAVPMILDAYILFLYNLIVCAEYYAKKTFFITMGTFVAAIINITANIFFLEKYGFYAAAYNTLFAYIVYLLLHTYISRRLAGFFIVEPKVIFIQSFILAVLSVVNKIFMDNMLIRWGISIMILLFIYRFQLNFINFDSVKSVITGK